VPIDVEKVDFIAYSPDRHDLWWRTIRSPNGSAESDDGLLTFIRTPADQVEVRIFARQRFRLPTGVAALGVERWPTIHRELVSDAYSRFFEGTLANLRAAYEGRPYRIGKPFTCRSGQEETSELRSVLAGAFAVIARTLGWAPAGGVTPMGGVGNPMEAMFVDELGFSHFPGQPAPAFVASAASETAGVGAPLTPALFLTELARAVGRDLAAMGGSELSGIMGAQSGGFGRSNDPGRDWAAAHLSGGPPAGRGWE
jgi:hypothetical protein